LRGDLDQIEPVAARNGSRLIGVDDADLLAVRSDNPNGCEADLLVDAVIRLWRRFSEEFFSSSDEIPPVFRATLPGASEEGQFESEPPREIAR
jgi:hypothetical protein